MTSVICCRWRRQVESTKSRQCLNIAAELCDSYLLSINMVYVCLQLVSFGTGILNGVDPNPDNFVCASILHTSAHQVGCLMRLEPNKQVQASSCFVLTRLIYILWECAGFVHVILQRIFVWNSCAAEIWAVWRLIRHNSMNLASCHICQSLKTFLHNYMVVILLVNWNLFSSCC